MKFCTRYFFLKIKTLFFRGKSSRPETTPDLCYCLQSSSMHPSESGAERPFPPCRGSWSTWPYCSLSTIKYMCTYSAPTGWVCRLCNIKKKCRRCGEKCDDFYKCLRGDTPAVFSCPCQISICYIKISSNACFSLNKWPKCDFYHWNLNFVDFF